MQITKVQAAIAAFSFMVLGGLMTNKSEVAVQQPVSQVQPELAQVQPAVETEVERAVYPPYALILYTDGTVKTFLEPEIGNQIVWECQAEESSDNEHTKVFLARSGTCVDVPLSYNTAIRQAVLGFRDDNATSH